ncbi:MAG: methyltransferase domain-containing protein [Streptococcaceae bacterium]|jgi:23S rRNA (guanine745-N1)-methyltransferase|nr:methyltransferase domain-containing protein [Streptococcaceae bacterium]
MKKKNVRALEFLMENDSLFSCPICHFNLSTTKNGLTCFKNHQFELSKKGTLFFLKKLPKTEYDKEMFLPRGRMIQSGMYAPIIEKMSKLLDKNGTTLDIGCGEGSFLNLLTMRGLEGIKIGFDISKDGVYEATNQPIYENIFWCIADLTNLPFAENSFNQLLNIFTPSQYTEFKRVLKPGGKLIKIIPEQNYLKELRTAFYPDDAQKQDYSNELVVQKLKDEMIILLDERISYSFEIPKNNQLDLLEMSPLEWGVSEEIKNNLKKQPLSSITIDIRVIVAEFA